MNAVIFVVAVAVASLGFARACDTVCLDQHAPVCGQLLPSGPGLTVYRTFDNACRLGVANCLLAGSGSAQQYEQRGSGGCAAQGLQSQCVAACLADWRPVCASREVNGVTEERTFGNACTVEYQSCLQSQNPFRIISEDEC